MKRHGLRKRCRYARAPHPQTNFVLGPGGQGSLVYSPENQQPAQPQAQSPFQVQYTDISTASSPIPTTSQTAAILASSSILPGPILSTTAISSSIFLTFSSTTEFVSPTATMNISSSSSAAAFSSASTSSVTTSSSSTSDVSTSTTQPLAVAVSSTTSASAPVSSSTSDLSQNTESNVPVYVGIALGTVVVIACLSALIAWSIRLHRHRRRSRNALTNVPWAKSADDDEARKLESGTSATTDDMSFNSLHTWEPRGDRDVGEPKRTESYAVTKPAPVQVLPPPPLIVDPYRQLYAPIPPQLPPIPHVQPLQESMYPLPPSRPVSVVQYPSPAHLPSQTLLALGPLQVANMHTGDRSIASLPEDYGTPRTRMDQPRFLSLGDGMGLDVPWRPSPPPSIQTVTPPPVASRAQAVPQDDPPELPTSLLPLPGESRIRRHHRESKALEDRELQMKESGGEQGWSESLRSSFISAFNAVAASIPTATHLSLPSDDGLTEMPKRRAERERDLSRLSTLEGYKGFDHAFSPVLPSLSATVSPTASVESFRTGISQAPLIPEKFRRHQQSKRTRMSGYTRQGGVSKTSTLSSVSSAPWRRNSHLSHLSYSASVRSKVSVMSELSEAEEVARKALCSRVKAYIHSFLLAWQNNASDSER